MAIWIIPFVFVTLISLGITVYAVRKSSGLSSLTSGRDEIADAIDEHPFTLNPIIWIILIATVFIGIVIFYYAAIY